MTIEDRSIIDKAIQDLNEETRNKFEFQYEVRRKSENKLFLMIGAFFILGVPFFYLGFKNTPSAEYITVILFWILIYPLVCIFFILLYVPILLLFFFILILILALMYIYVYVKSLMTVKAKVLDYNYEQKRQILKGLMWEAGNERI